MSDVPEPFFTAGEIRALARAALAERTYLWELSYDQLQGQGARIEAVRAAISYCSAAVAVLDDPELLDLAIELAEAAPWDELSFPPSETAGLTRLAGHRRVEGRLQELVDHERKELRLALAEGVDPASPRAQALLRKLTRDPDAHVRARATARLAEAGPLPWWTGKFEDDPYREMSPEARARHEPAVTALGELLGKPYLDSGDYAKLPGLTRDLPDALAAEALDKALGSDRYLRDEVLQSLAEALARHGEPAAAVVDRLRGRGGWGVGRSLPKAYLGALQGEARERRARAWLAELRERSPTRFALDQAEREGQGALSDALAEHWPPEADPTELLETALARFNPDNPYELATASLGRALARSRRDELLTHRFRAQLLRGFPDPWKPISHQVLAWFSARPALLPELVEQALEAGARAGEEVLAWALGHRLTTLYDPSRDGPLEALAEALDERPGLSGPLRAEHPRFLAGKLRRLLRAGELSADEAARTVNLVGRVQPGVLQGSPMGWMQGPPRAAPFPSPHALEFLGPMLGWAALKEPVTELEWAQLRRARAKAPLSRWPVQLQLEAFPEGPLAPEDRAYLEKVRGFLKQEPDTVLAGLAHYVYAMCGELSDLEAMVELEEVRGEDDERWCDSSFPHLRQALRERCGVSPKGGKPKLAVVGGGGKGKAKK